MRSLVTRPISTLAIIAAVLVSFALGSSRAAAQSPYFPNTQPVIANPYNPPPFGPRYGGGARLRLRPLPSVYSRPVPGPNPGNGAFIAPPVYGNHPSIRAYGGGRYN